VKGKLEGTEKASMAKLRIREADPAIPNPFEPQKEREKRQHMNIHDLSTYTRYNQKRLKPKRDIQSRKEGEKQVLRACESF